MCSLSVLISIVLMNLSQLINVASGLAHMHNMRSPIVHGDPKGVRVRVAVSLLIEMTSIMHRKISW